MKRSAISAFVNGVRGMLSAQLFASIAAIALAGWTLSVTNEVIRERDRLRERVIQLETSMAERGVVVPPTPAVVTEPVVGDTPYPGAIGAAANTAFDENAEIPIDASTESVAPAQAGARLNFSQIFTDLLAPAPPMRLVVLHVRAAADAPYAQQLGAELRRTANVQVVVDIIPTRDVRQSGYTYFDGRQNRATAALVTQFHDSARRAGIASWSAQLRGVALPAEGEYTADRLDIVLPPLPPPPPPPVVAPPETVPVPVTTAAPPG